MCLCVCGACCSQRVCVCVLCSACPNEPSGHPCPPDRACTPATPCLGAAGAAARAAEEQPAEELRDACLGVLRRLHPGLELPAPTAYTATKWASGKKERRVER